MFVVVEHRRLVSRHAVAAAKQAARRRQRPRSPISRWSRSSRRGKDVAVDKDFAAGLSVIRLY